MRLSLKDGAGRRIEKDPPLSGLGIDQIERVPVHVPPAQSQDFALPAADQQQKADDVRLPRARGSCVVVPIQGVMKSPDFIAREEADELDAGIPLDATRRVSLEMMAAIDRAVEDSAKQFQRPVCPAPRGPAALVEPTGHVGAGDTIKRQRAGRAIDVQMCRLRCKNEPEVQNYRHLQTDWGRGYVLQSD